MLAEVVWDVKSLAVVFGCAVPIVAIVSGIWFRIERTRSDNNLKRHMVERGLSVEEMERVMKLKPSRQ